MTVYDFLHFLYQYDFSCRSFKHWLSKFSISIAVRFSSLRDKTAILWLCREGEGQFISLISVSRGSLLIMQPCKTPFVTWFIASDKMQVVEKKQVVWQTQIRPYNYADLESKGPICMSIKLRHLPFKIRHTRLLAIMFPTSLNPTTLYKPHLFHLLKQTKLIYLTIWVP